MTRFHASLLFAVVLTIGFVPQIAEAATIGWWQFNDTSDSAPGGTRPLTLLDGAALVNVGGDMALDLSTDPSNNRARAAAFNPTGSFSVFIDFQADTLPSGSIDPQYTLLANIGNDSISRYFSQFSDAPGWQIYLRPNAIFTLQKNAGGFGDVTGVSLSLPNPTGRHRVMVNWEFSAGQFRSKMFLDGSATSTVFSTFKPMDFTGGATTHMLFGTNVDEAFQPPRTLDGKLFEVAIFDGPLTNPQIDALAAGGVQSLLVPEPASIMLAAVGLAFAAVLPKKRRARECRPSLTETESDSAIL